MLHGAGLLQVQAVQGFVERVGVCQAGGQVHAVDSLQLLLLAVDSRDAVTVGSDDQGACCYWNHQRVVGGDQLGRDQGHWGLQHIVTWQVGGRGGGVVQGQWHRRRQNDGLPLRTGRHLRAGMSALRIFFSSKTSFFSVKLRTMSFSVTDSLLVLTTGNVFWCWVLIVAFHRGKLDIDSLCVCVVQFTVLALNLMR